MLDGKDCRCGSGEPMFSEFDARGIYLCMACDKCRKEKLSHYKQDVLTNPNYWADEDIDPDPGVGEW